MSSKTDDFLKKICLSKRQKKGVAGLPFCSGNCADLFVDTEGWGIPFRMIIFSFPYSSIIWPQLLRSVFFISENGFGGCPRRSERERRPTTHNEKKRKPVSLNLSNARTGSAKRTFAFSYFQSLNSSSITVSIAVFKLFSII